VLEAFLEIISALEKGKVTYCIIGGIAVLIYGGRASTLDLDIYLVSSNRKKLIKTCTDLGATLHPRGEFQYQGTYRGFRFDVLIADRWVGLPAIKRAKKMSFASKILRIATPEDIIVMKSIADRPIDRRDIEELREIFTDKLDESYIQRRIRSVSKAAGST
jgi:hypothetical protein